MSQTGRQRDPVFQIDKINVQLTLIKNFVLFYVRLLQYSEEMILKSIQTKMFADFSVLIEEISDNDEKGQQLNMKYGVERETPHTYTGLRAQKIE